MTTLRAVVRDRDSWVVAIVVFLSVLFWDISWSYPSFPEELAFELVMPKGIPNRIEPIVVTGTVSKNSALMVAFTSEQTAALVYESSGMAWKSPVITYAPGSKISVQLRMPSLTTAGRSVSNATGPLLVKLNGHVLFQQDVPFHPCAATEVFFGEDPAGGPTVGVNFRGEIRTGDGRIIRGRPDSLFSIWAKISTWLRSRTWHLLPVLFLSVTLALGARKWLKPRASSDSNKSWLLDAVRTHRWFLATSAINVGIFVWVMTGGHFRLIYPDAFGADYDFQAQSLLQGRLDVPVGVFGGEAFIIDGRHYGYFGIVPALLRVPFVAGGIGFGHMTRSFMVVYYLGVLFGAYALLQRATRILNPTAVGPSGWAVGLLLLSVGGGTLLFLGSRAYVYHEVILCGVAFATWSAYFSFRYFEDPRARWWLSAFALGLIAVHSRPPVGLFALGLLVCTAASHLRDNPRLWRHILGLSALACAGILSLNLLAYCKFGTFDPAPFRYHVQYTPERIAKIAGKNFHLANLAHNLNAYLFSPGFRSRQEYPGVGFNLQPRSFPQAKIDLEEPTASILFAMAGLVLLSAVGCFGTLKYPQLRRPVVLLSVASLPLAACMFTFIGTSHRYTADFCPPLIALSVIGVAFLDQLRPAPRCLLLTLAAIATACSIALTLGLSFHFQSDLVWGVPDEVQRNARGLRD